MVQSHPPAPRDTPAPGAPERRAILITGASSGIGAALAEALAAPGRTLALLGRDSSRLQAVADACHAKGAICRTGIIDVCDQPAMTEFVTAIDRELGIDLLIVSAGIMTGRARRDALESGEAAKS
jgi:NADP-dependent 3-hydroxy acid dehydrogenase YdfG